MKAQTNNEIDARQEWIKETDRFEKMEWMAETCSTTFMRMHLVNEMTSWLEEDDFDKFFDHISACWEIETPPETQIERE